MLLFEPVTGARERVEGRCARCFGVEPRIPIHVVGCDDEKIPFVVSVTVEGSEQAEQRQS